MTRIILIILGLVSAIGSASAEPSDTSNGCYTVSGGVIPANGGPFPPGVDNTCNQYPIGTVFIDTTNTSDPNYPSWQTWSTGKTTTQNQARAETVVANAKI